MLVVLALFGALYIAITFVDALFSEVLTGETETGRAVASLLGISPRTLELAGTLISALVRVVLVLLAFFPVLGQWGIFAADVFGVLQDAAFGVRIGDITISITTILDGDRDLPGRHPGDARRPALARAPLPAAHRARSRPAALGLGPVRLRAC